MIEIYLLNVFSVLVLIAYVRGEFILDMSYEFNLVVNAGETLKVLVFDTVNFILSFICFIGDSFAYSYEFLSEMKKVNLGLSNNSFGSALSLSSKSVLLRGT